jgi:hypothetical protein
MAELRPRRKTVQIIALQHETAGPKESTQGNPATSSRYLEAFFSTTGTLTNSDKCGTMMTLLHGDRKDAGALSGMCTPLG